MLAFQMFILFDCFCYFFQYFYFFMFNSHPFEARGMGEKLRFKLRILQNDRDQAQKSLEICI